MLGNIFLQNIFVSILIVFLGFCLGIVFEKFVLRLLQRWSTKTKWQGDEIIFNSLKGMVILWFTVGALYLVLIQSPLSSKYLEVVEKIILIILIGSFTIVLTKIAGGFVELYIVQTKKVLPSVSILEHLTKITVFALGILIILQALGISITPILTALGIGGLAIALALQDTLSNFFAGIHIIASRQIKPGDYIRLDSGEEGYVTDINWRNTTIRALPNNMIIIPNSKLANAIITNYYQPEKPLKVKVQVGVSYDSDLEKVEKITLQVAKEIMKKTPGGVPDFEPVVRYQNFGDSSINFVVVLQAKEFKDQYLVKHEFIKKLHRRFQKEKIEIPFPIRTVYLKKTKK